MTPDHTPLVAGGWRCPPVAAVAIALASGGLLAVATFSGLWWVQLVSFFAIAPVFVLMRFVPANRYNALGVVFFAAWYLPTTYWYYSFMPWWLALLASVGFVALMANLFHLFHLGDLPALRGHGTVVAVGSVVVVWAGFTWLRLHLPVLEDWWLPHLGYAAWRNSGPLQAVSFGGEAALEALVLTVNAALACAAVSVRRSWAVLAVVAAAGAIIGSNLIVRQASPSLPLPVIAVQQMTTGGVDVPATGQDLRRLEAVTRSALDDPALRADSRAPLVVWPENSVPEQLRGEVADVARRLGTTLVYHSTEQVDGHTYKRVIILGGDGRELLSNTKLHLAPDEHGSSQDSSGRTRIDGHTVTAYACYDLHYPDSVGRIGNADLVLVPINDAAYGTLQRDFHRADLAIRAVQTRASIVSASTDGPTVHLDPRGVEREALRYGEDGVLVVPAGQG